MSPTVCIGFIIDKFACWIFDCWEDTFGILDWFPIIFKLLILELWWIDCWGIFDCITIFVGKDDCWYIFDWFIGGCPFIFDILFTPLIWFWLYFDWFIEAFGWLIDWSLFPSGIDLFWILFWIWKFWKPSPSKTVGLSTSSCSFFDWCKDFWGIFDFELNCCCLDCKILGFWFW